MQPLILWFRRDLRLADNAALNAAAETGRPIIPVYILDDCDTGGAARWWLHHSLQKLDGRFRQLGASLIIRRGAAHEELSQLVAETRANAIFFTKRYEPNSRQQESNVFASTNDGIEVRGFDCSLLQQPESLLTKSGTPYRVFTPFWNAVCAGGEPPQPKPEPTSMRFLSHASKSLRLEQLSLLPTAPDWAQGLRDTWSPGESSGLNRIDEVSDIVQKYDKYRDRPDLDATTRLSPHLHFGEVSVRQVWHAIHQYSNAVRNRSGAAALLRQLYWRDFSTYLLYHFPSLPDKPLRPEFEFFPWSDDQTHLRAWQQGKTGFPLVDAGMRQLRQSGWMHNRVRMIVASFLIKDLRIPWQTGAAWFFDNLVDADLANNSASWQWVAGCGTDAAPFFRVFNPTVQAKKFDPDERYIRRWLPELSDATHGAYPSPIVDHGVARQTALDAFQTVKGTRTSMHAP